MSATLVQDQLDKVAGLPSREAAEVLGVSKSTVNKYREIARLNGGHLPIERRAATEQASIETRNDGGLNVETQDAVPQTKDDIDAAMVKRGFDPTQYTFNYRFSEWQAQVGGGDVITMYAARASATPIRGQVGPEALDATELLEQVKTWDFTPVIREEFASVDAALGFADPQLGKVDQNGGTSDTVNQILQSFYNFTEIIKEEKPHDVLFGDLGDGLENFYNTPSQRETNDLDLTGQVRVLRRIQAEGLKMIAPYCKRIRHRSVPSNHGIVRIGPQMPASTASNDWGLEVSHQLEDVFAMTNLSIDFGRPNGKEALSLRVDLENGTRTGMSHGDQAAQNALPNWWMHQAFGWDNPLRDVDLFLYGHHHNHALDEVYENRWAIGCASSDRGSAWFTNRTGRSASSGMTTFLTAGGKFWNLQIV